MTCIVTSWFWPFILKKDFKKSEDTRLMLHSTEVGLQWYYFFLLVTLVKKTVFWQPFSRTTCKTKGQISWDYSNEIWASFKLPMSISSICQNKKHSNSYYDLSLFKKTIAFIPQSKHFVQKKFASPSRYRQRLQGFSGFRKGFVWGKVYQVAI